MMVVILGGCLMILTIPFCGHDDVFPYTVTCLVAAIRIVAMIRTGIAQEATARMIASSPQEAPVVDAVIRHERRMRYKKWLWWTRIAMMITVLQLVVAIYLMFNVAKYVSQSGGSSDCVLEIVSNSGRWKLRLLVLFMILVCFVALVQCFTGTDVLKWRSFYATQDNAWKAHYQEVFDHGIREALCCLGRVKYLSVLDEDEVHSVARLLGDLVAYRASGTGHLELLAGLALLQRQSPSPPKSYEGSMEAPGEHIQMAATFHKFAEAAYTGPLLDFGRNPVLFPCAWLYRQGVLTPWARKSRPMLQGDNWWRGHAAAYLKYANLSPEALRRGRVCQAKCEAAYFIVVLHHLRCVVIAVRGTETPEDLITDGLCKECTLSEEDLDGLINSSHIHPLVSQRVISSFPHYGHSGIVETARNLFMEIAGNLGDDDSSNESGGFLSSLLGPGCECAGYNLLIVGHSLGGSIATMLGVRLYHQYPDLHVYAYGSLPCVDSVIADACSEFVTCIVYNNEFSACLSVGSLLRLRASALTTLSKDTTTNSTIVQRLARRFLYVSNNQWSEIKEKEPEFDLLSEDIKSEGSGRQDQVSLWRESSDSFTNPFHEIATDDEDSVSQFMEAVPTSERECSEYPPEMFLPGLVIHIIPQHQTSIMPLWHGWGVQEKAQHYKAYIANRENFKDIPVSPSMFLDHLPWRMQYAMQKILEARNAQFSCAESQMV